MSTARRTALITGASAGIGAAIAREFARGGHDLLLVARRREMLESLATQLRTDHGVRTRVIAKDLLRRSAPDELYRALRATGVDVLVNNAGVYEITRFEEMPPDRAERMLQLNVVATAALVRRFAVPMLERGHGRILNVASVAGFQAVPFLSLYAATKAFVVSLTEGLAEEFKGTGVTVTAVCPGITETEGFRNARAGSAEIARVPGLLVSSEDDVAREAYQACMAGEVIRVPGAINRAFTQMNRVPRTVSRVVGGAVWRRIKPRE